MTNMYSNELGKSRLIDADSAEHSSVRKKWFQDFELVLRASRPDLLKDVKLTIVGSVAKDLASPNSDIDIVIQPTRSEPLLIPKIRQAIFLQLNEMRASGLNTYDLNIQEVGNPLLFSQVANFRRDKQQRSM